jgi:NhaA family Na+:H+ antiporter
MSVSALKNFLKMESTAGLLLVAATVIALLVSNSPLLSLYQELLNVRLAVSLGELSVDKPLLLWINDGLMAIFFMLVGLEIKREILDGQLSSADQVVLPAVAALGGFVLPALFGHSCGDRHRLRPGSINGPRQGGTAGAQGVSHDGGNI